MEEQTAKKDPPTTSPSLLIRIRDAQDRQAWEKFVDLYGPLIYQFGRKRGLQDADAVDLTQNVFQAVSASIRGLDYDPRRGSFRGWLYSVARHHLQKFFRSRKRTPQASGDSDSQDLLEAQPDRNKVEAALWDREYERQIFLWAAEKVRGSFDDASWQAFWQTAVEGQSGKTVAQALGMSVGAVYTAKSRVLNRLRKVIQELEPES